MSRTVSSIVVAAALALGGACGGDGTDRPTAKDLTETFERDTNLLGGPRDASTAACVAKILESSALSDAALTAIVEIDLDYRPSTKDQEVLSSLTDTFSNFCAA